MRHQSDLSLAHVDQSCLLPINYQQQTVTLFSSADYHLSTTFFAVHFTFSYIFLRQCMSGGRLLISLVTVSLRLALSCLVRQNNSVVMVL